MGLFGPPDIIILRAMRDVKGLIKALRNKEYDIRRRAAEALGDLADTRAVEPLIITLQDKDARVPEAAARALGKIGDTRAVEPLIKALPSSGIFGQNVAEALGNLGDTRAVEPLIQFLNDSTAGWKAAEALGKLRDTRAVEPLIEALKDPSRVTVRVGAAEALGRIGDIRAVEPLMQSLKDHDRDIRLKTADALGKIGSTQQVESLIEALKDTDIGVRLKAIQALEIIGDARAIVYLIKTLKDENKFVREQAAKAWRTIKIDESIADNLIEALRDEDKNVRKEAMEALRKINWVPSDDSLWALYYVENHEFSKAVSLGESSVEPLIRALKGNDFFSGKAAEALGKIGDTRAVEPLIWSLNKGGRCVEEVRALGKIGDTRAFEPLIQLLFSSHGNVGGYALLQLAPYTRVSKEIIEDAIRASGYDYEREEERLSLERSNAAIHRLCSVNSPITSNLLILISKKKDTSVWIREAFDEDNWERTISFGGQRGIAKAELVKRGSPVYEQTAYLESSNQ